MLAIVKMTLIALLVTANDRRKTPVKFCVKITQNGEFIRPCLCRMNKYHASLSCVSHTAFRGNIRLDWQA